MCLGECTLGCERMANSNRADLRFVQSCTHFVYPPTAEVLRGVYYARASPRTWVECSKGGHMSGNRLTTSSRLVTTLVALLAGSAVAQNLRRT